MNYAKISDKYSVATQIDPGDVAFFAGEGFTTIICNRPDGEDPGQPTSASIRAACEQQGIDFYMIPMQGRIVSSQSVQEFREVLENAAGPVLGYCRSGTRSAMLWQFAERS